MSAWPSKSNRPPQEPRSLGKKCWVALCMLAGIAWLRPAAGADDLQLEAYFAEPITGRRVSSYVADLPVDRFQRRRFSVPGECGDVLGAIQGGATFKGTILDRRLWQKVEADCRYHEFLHRHPMQEVEDHVSTYDFMNARLSDMPIAQCTVGAGPGTYIGCEPWTAAGFNMLHQFALIQPVANAPDKTLVECVLNDGLFYGQMFVGPDGILCDPDASVPSLRLIGVDFADINGDHILDAVMRFVPIGPGAARSPLILPLTRTQDSGPFSIPELLPPPLPASDL